MMRFGYALPVAAILTVSTGLHAAAAPRSYVGSSSAFTVAQTTEVPGLALKAGDYTIRVLDQLADRMIVRVDSTSGKDHAIFLGVPTSSLAGGAGVVSWSSSPKGTAALRGFSFPAGTVEFVYPKAEAVELAKLNTSKVLAIDPESENLPAMKSLSKDDLQIVNLWTLSLTSLGSGADKKPGILAQHYESSAANTAVASTPAPTPQPAAVSPTPRPTQVASLEQPQQIGSSSEVTAQPVRRKPVLAKLPKTGSSMPLIWLIGFLAFLSAACIRTVRMVTSKA